MSAHEWRLGNIGWGLMSGVCAKCGVRRTSGDDGECHGRTAPIRMSLNSSFTPILSINADGIFVDSAGRVMDTLPAEEQIEIYKRAVLSLINQR